MKKRENGSDDAPATEPRRTRREILRGGLLIAGAAAAARVAGGGAKAAEAADDSPLILGQMNDASKTTSLLTPPGTTGLSVMAGTNLDPNAPAGIDDFALRSALRGSAVDAIGIRGYSQHNTGVVGQAGTALHTDPNQPIIFGVFGASADAIGVAGRSLMNSGVLGHTGGQFSGDPNTPLPIAGIIGLAGISTDPNNPDPDYAGVVGFAQDPNNPAILARNFSEGLALNVQGRALFSSAGKGAIPAGVDRVLVSHSAVTPTSVVLVTLSSDPVGGRRLKFVIAENGGFTVVLSSKAKLPVNFGYLVVN
jgi:hypothetical protein